MPQTSLPTALDDRQEPLAQSMSPDGNYRLLLFPGDVVAIQKPAGSGGAAAAWASGWKTIYIVREGICPCQGHQWRAACKHGPWAAAFIAWAKVNLPPPSAE